MRQILVLIADPARADLDHSILAEVAAAVPAAAAPLWLAPGIAAEIPLAAPADPAAIRARLANRPVDAALVDAAGRRKPLLVADMESTVIRNELIDDIAGFLGKGAEVAEITRRGMNGELDFEQSLTARVAMLAGQPAAILDRAAAGIEEMPGARTLVRTMRAHGAYTALVSGGFDVFTRLVRDRLGFDQEEANALILDGERIAGRVREPILNRDGKRRALLALIAARGLTPAAALAVGDGANDLAMLGTAGLGVAFRAKPAVAAAAPIRIDHGDLTALLYLQGYRQADFVL